MTEPRLIDCDVTIVNNSQSGLTFFILFNKHLKEGCPILFIMSQNFSLSFSRAAIAIEDKQQHFILLSQMPRAWSSRQDPYRSVEQHRHSNT